jgi:hypothetical protein
MVSERQSGAKLRKTLAETEEGMPGVLGMAQRADRQEYIHLTTPPITNSKNRNTNNDCKKYHYTLGTSESLETCSG